MLARQVVADFGSAEDATKRLGAVLLLMADEAVELHRPDGPWSAERRCRLRGPVNVKDVREHCVYVTLDRLNFSPLALNVHSGRASAVKTA